MPSNETNDFGNAANEPNKGVGGTEHRKDEVLGGRYRVISFLGRGGMGVVYKVEQIFLGKELALKTIDAASQSDIAVRRFQAEARAVFAVNHPNIVSVHDFGLLDDQTPFLAMEFVQGETLGELIKVRALPADDALKIFIQVCFGLAHAHKSGVVHRDVKPNNIMILDNLPLGTEGSVKILDFGIAKLTQHDAGEIQALTRTGEIFGSPIYMSPEQCTGGKVDLRSDIYSLGCVIFEALTGTPPFVGESALSTMMMHQTAVAPTLKEASLGTSFSPDLEKVVQTMLSKNPDDRYQDLGVAALDLAAIKSGQTGNLSISATKPARVLRVSNAQTISMRRQHFMLYVAGVAVVSIAITFLGMQMWFASQASKVVVVQELGTVVPNAQVPNETENIFKAMIDRKNIRFREDSVTDQNMQDFQGYDGAQLVHLKHTFKDQLTNKGLAYLASSKILSLTLEDCQIKNIDSVEKLPYLFSLDLNRSTLDDSSMSKIAKLKMLTVLNLENCKNISEDGIRKLIPSTSLHVITLTPNRFTPEFIKELNEKMPQCAIKGYGGKHSPLRHQQINSKDKDEYRKFSTTLEIAKKINPIGTSVAESLLALTVNRVQHSLLAEGRKFIDESVRILEQNGNDIKLTVILKDAANVVSAQHDLKALAKYSDKLVELAPVTCMHDEPQLYDLIMNALGHANSLNDRERMIKYCDVGIKYGAQFRKAAKDHLCTFYSDAGDASIWLNRKDKAAHYYDELQKLAEDPEIPQHLFWHAAATIKKGMCEPDRKAQKAELEDGFSQIKSRGSPDEMTSLEHYCEACTQLSRIALTEGNWQNALDYDQKGLDMVDSKMSNPQKHPDAKKRQREFVTDMCNILKQRGQADKANALLHQYKFDTGI